MASIVVNGDTSGSVTLSAPAVAGTVTVTLPATTGTMLTTASSTGISGSAISSGTVAEAYGGTGTNTGYYGFKNRIINGAMVISQRGTSPTITGGGDYSLDRFGSYYSGNAFTSVQSTTAPVGFINSMLFTVTSTSASPTYSFFYQRIEGFNCADLGFGLSTASTITLSFWVRSSVTGIYSIALGNDGGNRSYAAQYTINSANTWEQKTITILGDTSGTWLTNNAVGISVRWNMGTSSGSRLISAGSWQAANADGATGSTGANTWANTASATFYITGVQLEKGSTATSFDYRPYGTELNLCQRYYWQSASKANGTQFWEYSGAVTDGTTVRINFYLPTAMRTQPSIAINPAYNTGSSWQINVTGITNYALTQAPTILGNDGAASGGGNMIAIAFKSSGISSAQYGLGAIPYATTGTATNNFQFSAEL